MITDTIMTTPIMITSITITITRMAMAMIMALTGMR
jgi:hypothetical protein